MPLPNIVLNKDQILLSQVDYGKSGISMINNGNLFVEVAAVNDLCTKYNVGDFVLFNPNDSTALSYLTKTYFITTEDKIIFKEII